jgi:SPP1 gp7 family putative phage head morphogenesis protein
MAPSDRGVVAIDRRYAVEVGRIYQRHIRAALAEVAAHARARVRADDDDDDLGDMSEDGVRLDAAAEAEAAYAMREAAKRAAAAAALVPVPEDQIRTAMATQARQALRAERSYLVRLGASPRRLADRIGVPRDRLLGIDIIPDAASLAALEERVRAHLDLIRRIPQEQLVGYEAWIGRSIAEGRTYRTIAAELEGRLGIDARHAELIARDQTNKLNAAMTKATQTGAGMDRYVWRATDDDRTRETHAAVDGIVWLWSSPPPDTGPYGEAAHPGEGIQCRCTAEPVIPAALREDFGLTEPEPMPGDVVPLGA